MITQSRLKELLHYDPETGSFTWLVQKFRGDKGATAGCNIGHGYWKIGIDRKRYYAHHLAWLYMTGEWPVGVIDHRDGDALNNRWANLRLADKSLNAANMRTPKSNTSGRKGVTWLRREKKWLAQIKVNGRRRALGYFDDKDEAAAAYENAARASFGEFARVA